jgi:hypothetical protein
MPLAITDVTRVAGRIGRSPDIVGVIPYRPGRQSRQPSPRVHASSNAPGGCPKVPRAGVSHRGLTLPPQTPPSYAEPLRIRRRNGFEDRPDDPPPRRRSPRRAYSWRRPPGLPTGPVGNHAHDVGGTTVPPGSPVMDDGVTSVPRGNEARAIAGARVRRRMSGRCRCRTAVRTPATRGHPRRECLHRLNRNKWPSVRRGHLFPYQLSVRHDCFRSRRR